ncbi:MAG: GNAT family N-acetyltransferase [Dehalococcoidia bacterium]
MTVEIIDTNLDNILKYGICGYKDLKHDGLRRKIEWLKDRFSEGMKIKTLYSDADGTQGMIEYLPGEYSWRPVTAGGYMFIHCIFVGFKRDYKGKGYGSLLVAECLREAREKNMSGVAVVTRAGPFMAGKELFVKLGFEIVDTAPSDFELLVAKFDERAPLPRFKKGWEEKLDQYGDGLTIFQSDQCPYLAKCIPEISETAERVYGIKPRIVELKSCRDAQDSPCGFGVFGIVYNGKIIAEHMISSKRFSNIMRKELKG